MTDARHFTDEDLGRFLDGEADAELTHAIRTAMKADEELSSQVAALQGARDQFAAAFEPLLSLAPEPPTLPEMPQQGVPAWATGLAGMAAGIVLALGAVWSLTDRSGPNWRDVVANYQSLYVTETLAQVNDTPEQSAQKLQELSKVLGLDLTQLPEVEGLTYRRAQQLGFKGKPLAQLTFLTKDGGPVALCILRTTKADSDAILAETLDGLAAYSWISGGYGILLIGPTQDQDLKDAEKVFRAALGQTA